MPASQGQRAGEPLARRDLDPRDAVVWLLARVPLALADASAWLLAWAWWWVLPIRRAVAVENLRLALPEVAPRPTLTRMMHDLVLGYVELARYHREHVAGGARTVTVRVEPNGLPPGALLVSGHGGSWDLALLAAADSFPTAIFLKTPTDPWVRDRLAAWREAHDVLGLWTGTGMADAYAALEAGRGVFFIQDQHYPKGITSPFFGRPARTSAGLAAAHVRTGAPVWGTWPVREGTGRHRLVFGPVPLPALTGERDADVQRVTDAVNRWYEGVIRAAPHGWLWLHRRWKGGS